MTDSNKLTLIEYPPDPGLESYIEMEDRLAPGEKDSIPTYTYEYMIDESGNIGHRELINTEWKFFVGIERKGAD